MAEAKKKLKAELKAYQKKGIELQLGNEKSSPKKIVKACSTAEEGTYMREYECDANGRVKRLSFQWIKSDR